MNFSNYGQRCAKFHGFQSYRIQDDIIILDLTHLPWEPWFVSRLYQANRMMTSKQHIFVQALQIYFKSETQCSIFCKDDSWTILMGKERVIIPMANNDATFQLYLTPLYVRDPTIVDNYLQGIARPAYDHVYTYKNTILYLDGNDIPYPGGCYFDAPQSPSYYRLCFLTNEPIEKVKALVSEWKLRRDVLSIHFLSQESITRPKFIRAQPIKEVELNDENFKSTGLIRKTLCLKRPHLLLHDILQSYLRHCERTSTPSLTHLNHLGIVIQWPFRVTFEGARVRSTEDDTQYVALAINGNRPTHVLYVRQPYERFMEFNQVPAVAWTFISYVPTVLQVSPVIEKVSIDSTVIGFTYRNVFFCFGKPLLEGRPSEEFQRNTNEMFNLITPSVLNDSWITVIETVRYDQNHSLHRVQMKDIPYDAWCLSKAEDAHAYPKQFRLPFLVEEWLNLYTMYHMVKPEETIDANLVRLALVLARHKICFKNKINLNQKKNQIMLTDNEIELHMGEKVVDFINSLRLEERVSGLEEAQNVINCTIM